tara:strand:+ start:1374 stop:2246 length:873 start_codon:yes stop_codon:yes gene_type:complete
LGTLKNNIKRAYQKIYYEYCKRHIFALSSGVRVLPDFIVIGVGRGATTTLHHNLSKNPCVFSAAYDEIGFFDENYHLGEDWYRSLFPTKYTKNKTIKDHNHFLSFEVTPSYIRKPWAARRIKQVLPHAKLIAILRNPVDRTYSHYNMGVNESNEQRSFEDVIKKDLIELKKFKNSNTKSDDYFKTVVENSFLARGLYVEQLKIWFKIFDKKQIHITTTENLAMNPDKTFSEIFNFLEIPDYKIPKLENKRKGNYLPMSKEMKIQLSNYFKPYNEELYELIEQKFNWNDEL